MKKFATVVLVLALALGMVAGCCDRLQLDGTTTTSFFNCFQNAEDILCDPPADVMAVARTAAPLLLTVVGMLIPGSAPYVMALSGTNAADRLQQGLCVTSGMLNDMIATLQSPTAQAAQEKMVATKALSKGVDIQPLINWQVMKKAKGK